MRSLQRIIEDEGVGVESDFYRALGDHALRKFDEQFVDGLADKSMKAIHKRVAARKEMFYLLKGRIPKILYPPEFEAQEIRAT